MQQSTLAVVAVRFYSGAPMSIPYADIVVFALVAGFILLRLRSVLGQQTGFDGTSNPMASLKPKEDVLVQRSEKPKLLKGETPPAVDVPLPDTLPDADRKVIVALKSADPQFTIEGFLRGAKGAFEMVFDAFLTQDKATLDMLLSGDLSRTFLAAAAARKEGERVTETTLVCLESATITGAQTAGAQAHITVTFISEQVTLVRNAQGKIVEGDPSHTARVEDTWTFARDMVSKQPNWVVIDT